MDLEKTFDCVLKVIWCARGVAEIPEWIITLVKSMYNNAKSRVRVDCEYSNVFSVNVDVHQGLILSSFLFFIFFLRHCLVNFKIFAPESLHTQMTQLSLLSLLENSRIDYLSGN